MNGAGRIYGGGHGAGCIPLHPPALSTASAPQLCSQLWLLLCDTLFFPCSAPSHHMAIVPASLCVDKGTPEPSRPFCPPGTDTTAEAPMSLPCPAPKLSTSFNLQPHHSSPPCCNQPQSMGAEEQHRCTPKTAPNLDLAISS